MIKMWAIVITSALIIDNLNGQTYFFVLIFLVKNKAKTSETIENTKKYVKSVINKKNSSKISVWLKGTECQVIKQSFSYKMKGLSFFLPMNKNLKLLDKNVNIFY